MWRKYPNGKIPLKPSTNPKNPNALDKLAEMVKVAEARYKEKMEKRSSVA